MAINVHTHTHTYTWALYIYIYIYIYIYTSENEGYSEYHKVFQGHTNRQKHSHPCVCVCVCVCTRVYPGSLPGAGCETSSIFLAEQCRFKFTIFLPLDWRRSKPKEPSFPYYLSITYWHKRWIHAFPKDISANWDANSFNQVLHSGHQFHFLRR